MNVEGKLLRMRRLKRQIAKCERCDLYRTRINAVPGEGSLEAEIMFIGEAPGKNEDLQGKPFVGRAGDIFDRLLDSAGLSREEIYLCNILKCRPPGNRDPLDKEIKACVGSLDIQIKIINPKIIATLGRFASSYILQKFFIENMKISDVHGKVIEAQTPFGVKKIIPLFHPAVATYDPSKLKILIKDFKALEKSLSTITSG